MEIIRKLTFYIRTFNRMSDQINFPSTEDVQRTFADVPANEIIAWTDHCKLGGTQCYAHSYPYRMKYYDNITNQFPGGLFRYVTEVSLYDQRPFEREFFVRIQKSFPVMQRLTIENKQPPTQKTNRNDEHPSIIEYSRLKQLCFVDTHDDYLKQFLFHTEISFPNNVGLTVGYESLKNVTNNFQQDETRINCAKMNYYHHRDSEPSEDLKNYFASIRRC